MFTAEKVRVHNPQSSGRRPAARRPNVSRKARRSNTNPMLVEVRTPGRNNPHKRGAEMFTKKKKAAKRPRKSSNPAARSRPRRKASNPSAYRRRRNGGSRASMGGAVSLVTRGFWALLGLIITRQAAQMALGAKNTGAMGYLANGVAAFGASMLVGRMVGTDAGQSAGIGGGLYLINRVLSESTNPIAKSLASSGLGDAQALGEIASPARSYFPLPVAYDNNRSPIIPSQIDAMSRPLPMPGTPPASTMGAWGRRGR